MGNEPKYFKGVPPSMYNNKFYTGVSGMKVPIPEDESRRLTFAQMAHNPFANPYSSAIGFEDPGPSHQKRAYDLWLAENEKTRDLNTKREADNILAIDQKRPMNLDTIKSSLNYPNGYQPLANEPSTGTLPISVVPSVNSIPANIPAPSANTIPTTVPPVQMPTEAEIRSGVQRPAPLYSSVSATPQFNTNVGVVNPIAKPYGTYANRPDSGVDAAMSFRNTSLPNDSEEVDVMPFEDKMKRARNMARLPAEMIPNSLGLQSANYQYVSSSEPSDIYLPTMKSPPLVTTPTTGIESTPKFESPSDLITRLKEKNINANSQDAAPNVEEMPFPEYDIFGNFIPGKDVQAIRPEEVDVPRVNPIIPTTTLSTPTPMAYPGTRGYGTVQMPTEEQVRADAFPIARDKGVQQQQPYPESIVQMPTEQDVRNEAFPNTPTTNTDVSTMSVLDTIRRNKENLKLPQGMSVNTPSLGLGTGNKYTTQPNLQNGTSTLNTPTVNGQPLTTEGIPMQNAPASDIYNIGIDIPPATNQPTADTTTPTTKFNGLPSLLSAQGVPYENARNATQVPPYIDPSDPYGLRNRASQRMGFPYPGVNNTTTPTTASTTPAAKDTAANTQNRLPYFDLIKSIDMTALARNMAQGPPPSMQNPITHMPRVHYDRTIYDTQRQQIAEGSNRAQYEARQQLGQAGDFQQMMLGINAQQQQQQQQVGLQERDMRMQELNQNAQISGQEQTMQDQQNLQEQQMNYQIQQQAQMAKDQAVSQGLGNIKNDVMQETQYNESKNTIAKQEAIDLQHREDQKKISMMTLGMQAEDVWDDTPEYQQGLNQSYLQHQAETNQKVLSELQGDPLWKDRVGDIKEYSVDTHDKTDKLAKTYEGKIENWNKEQDLKTAEHDDVTTRLADLQSKLPTLTGTELEAAKQNIDHYEKRLGALGDEMEAHAKSIDTHQQAVDTLHNNSEVYGEMKKRFSSSYDLSGAAKKYREKARGDSEILKRYKELEDYLK